MIKAIETRYKGYRFRSRLEARWAVFFDALGVPWEYEKEGYELPSGRYLPDFWLPRERVWLEIKPNTPSDDEQRKCGDLAIQSGSSVILLCGSPHTKYIPGWYGDVAEFEVQTYHGWHAPNRYAFGFHSWIFAHKFEHDKGLYSHLREHGYNPPPPPANTRDAILSYVEMDCDYWRKTYGGNHPTWKYGFRQVDGSFVLSNGLLGIDMQGTASTGRLDGVIVSALAAARAARFEYGETPQ